MSSLRIFMIATGADTSGGGEKHMLDLSAGLIERGHRVMVMAPGGGDVLDAAAQLGCDTHEVASFGMFSRVASRDLARLRKTWHPDIVHAHGPRAAYVVRRGDTASIPRLVYTIHGIHAGHGPLGAIKLAVERADVNKVAAYITTCKADLDQGARLGILNPHQTTVIYNGVPNPRFVPPGRFRDQLGIPSTRPLVLHVGRITPPKDHATLLAAFDKAWSAAPAGEHKPFLTLVTAGSERARRTLQRTINALRSAGDIALLTSCADLAPLYTDADMFVLSSLWEARPYVLVEAMQYGCPVVSTDVGGVSEAVEDGVTGFLTPPADAHALADAMAKLLDDDELRMRMGRAAQQSMVDRFTLDEMVEQTLAVYHGVRRALL
ncbi:MAG: glycosyltransferase family 4 protein [Coriobacteriia bacterium]|nr:glycosyltransferase family 4 protein [Coriobacteriia bacterium]